MVFQAKNGHICLCMCFYRVLHLSGLYHWSLDKTVPIYGLKKKNEPNNRNFTFYVCLMLKDNTYSNNPCTGDDIKIICCARKR